MNFFQNSILLIMTSVVMLGCKPSNNPKQKDTKPLSKSDIIEINKTLVRKDEQRILGYITRKGLDMQQTNTGLWYAIDSLGHGQQAQANNIVRLNYTLELLDGTVCYSSGMDGVKEFVVSKGGVESGLEEAILMMRAGDKGMFIMPPHLAHGLTGDGERIPARSIIIYNIEVLSVQSH